MEEEIILEKKYSIPYDMFGRAFITFQKKFVYPKNYIISVLFLIVAVLNIVKAVRSGSSTLDYVFICVCFAAAFINWFNPRKLRRSLMQSIKGIENDVYRMKLMPEKIVIGTVIEPEKEFDKTDEEYEGVFEDIPGPEEISDTDIYMNSRVIVLEKSEFFMVYLKKAMFYVIPKKDFSEEEITVMQIHFDKQLGKNYRKIDK